uniref:Fork-head domain-containing protein n=1 Tax=Plectus sambesii TaxID=2011161 RepID=A0A914WJY6_9BILA
MALRSSTESGIIGSGRNSIRHNLSLHSRFMRIQNEGAGKSSWWVINPEAKPGRNPRRRAQTLETSSKATAAIEKKRGRVRRKVAEMRAAQQGQTLHSASSSVVGSQASLVSHDLYPNDDDNSLGAVGLYDNFRPRAHSNLSMPGTSARVSPSIDGVQQRLNAFDAFDDFPFDTNPIIPNDILDRTGDMRLDASPLGGQPSYQGLNALLGNDQMINGLGNSHGNSVMPTSQIKMEPGIRMNIKSEQPNLMQLVQPPPSYVELSTVRQGGNMQNPLLRNQSGNPALQQPQQPQQQLSYNRNSAMTNGGVNGDYFRMINTTNGVYATNVNGGWPMTAPTSCAQQLPMDLANLSLPNEPGMEMDVAEVLRHEMAATGGKLDFGDFASNL